MESHERAEEGCRATALGVVLRVWLTIAAVAVPAAAQWPGISDGDRSAPGAWIPALDVLAPPGEGGLLRLEPGGALFGPAEEERSGIEGGPGFTFSLYRLPVDRIEARQRRAVLEAAAVGELLGRLGEPAPVWSGQAVEGVARALRGGQLVRYLRTVESTVVEGAEVAVPIQDVVVDGVVATCRLHSRPHGPQIDVELAVRRTDVLWPMRTERTPRGNLQLPAVRTERFVLRAAVPSGGGCVFGGGGEEASRWLLVADRLGPRPAAAPAAETAAAEPQSGVQQLELAFGVRPPGRPESAGPAPTAGTEVDAELRALCGETLLLPLQPDGRCEAAFGIRQAGLAGFVARTAPGVAVLDPQIDSVWAGVQLRAGLGAPAADGRVPLQLSLRVDWPSAVRRGGLASGIEAAGTLDLAQHDTAQVEVPAARLEPGGNWQLLESVEVGDGVGRLLVLGRLGAAGR